jgi:hypothetical protein
MDSDGRIVDTTRGPPDVSDEEVLQWYKNMVVGKTFDAPGYRHRADALHCNSEYYGYSYVRSTKAGPFELLYGIFYPASV